MSKARDNRKRLQRSAAAGGDDHRAIMRLAPDSTAWTDESLERGIGKSVSDGTQPAQPVIGHVRRLWRKDGWIMAEVGLSPEHVARITGPALDGLSINAPGGRPPLDRLPAFDKRPLKHPLDRSTARRVRTPAGVQQYSANPPGTVIAP